MTNPPVVALARAKSTETFPEMQCLVFVRTRFGVGPKALTAAKGLAIVEVLHRNSTPPPGVPVWWTGGEFGHVAISAGGGRVISTDWPRSGSVGRVGIARLTDKWHKSYQGWSEDINGVTIIKTPRIPFAKLVAAATPGHQAAAGDAVQAAVAVVKAALYCEGLLDQEFAFAEKFGNRSLSAYAGWQRRIGLEGKTPNGLPGLESLTKMGRKYGFDVHD